MRPNEWKRIRGIAGIGAVLLCLGLWCGVPAGAVEFKIVVNPSVKVSALSMEQLRRVFLLKSNALPDGTHVEPVIGTGSPAYEEFLKHCLGKSDAALNTYYRSLVFTGRALMPKTLESDAAVIAYVARTKGAVGYVSVATKTDGLKAVPIK